MPLPTDPQEKFNYYADQFIGQRGDWEEIRRLCDINVQSAMEIFAIGEGRDNATPEQRAAECLREVMKPIKRWVHDLNMMHEALGMPVPFRVMH